MMTNARDHAFFDVPRMPYRTSLGVVDLPILYYDVTNVVALFEASRAGVDELLEGTGLCAGLVQGDTATVGLSFYEYRDSSVGSYNEVGTALLAVREGQRRPMLKIAELLRSPRRRTLGAYVVDLPVTTELACAGGREIYGYPKFVTDISFLRRGRDFRSAVLDPDGDAAICELAGKMGMGVPSPPLSLMTYTLLDGALLRTHVDVRGRSWTHAPGSMQLDVGPSDHPMARNLRTLGLDGARPTVVMATDRFQSLLHAGTWVR
ncbi:MAG: acetoacetate decarboxylase family protein [Bradymonadaceae bacterium]